MTTACLYLREGKGVKERPETWESVSDKDPAPFTPCFYSSHSQFSGFTPPSSGSHTNAVGTLNVSKKPRPLGSVFSFLKEKKKNQMDCRELNGINSTLGREKSSNFSLLVYKVTRIPCWELFFCKSLLPGYSAALNCR